MKLRFTTVALAASLLAVLLLISGVRAESQYFNRSIQGTKYKLSFIEGALDPADPDRGYVELNLTTFQSLDLVLAARYSWQANVQQRYQTRRVNASVGTPRMENFVFFLNELGIEESTQGLMSMVFVFPVSGARNHAATVVYNYDGETVRFQEVQLPLE
jgi:hypothetical protein